MGIELRNSELLPAPVGFSHASIGTGSRVVHLAGQIGTDAAGAHPDGLAAQTEQALRNVVATLDGIGLSVDDLAKLTVYVVGWTAAMTGDFLSGMGAAGDLNLAAVPITLVGVQSLFLDESLIEIEGVAVAE